MIMIKKVSNWVFGSFFRTMGRFFFFLFFGFLLATILSKSEIKMTDLLGIEIIKADSYYRKWDTVWYDDSNLTQQWNSGTTFQYKTLQAVQYYNSNLTLYQTYSRNKIDMNAIKGGHITIPFVLEIPLLNKQIAHNVNTCTEWYDNPQNDYIFCSSVTSTLTEYNDYYIPIQLEMNVMVRYTSGYNDVCEVDFNTNYISCPIINSSGLTFDGLIIAIKVYADGQTSNYRLGLGDKINGWTNDSQSIINNQNQNHNETMSYFQDENTTQAESEANNFFSNFSSQDNGGISSIITAPLSAISGLVSATCTPITLPLPYLDNKTIVLPCMSAIYQEHFGAFFTIYQTIIFGALAYRMLVSIFMMIQGFKNPDDDKIEVVDL